MVAALFIKWMFVARWGLIDATLASLDLFGPSWLGHPGWAKFTVILADAWKFAPFMVLVLYAGLRSMDQNLIDAARIDGCNNRQAFYRVVLPVVRPGLAVTTLFSLLLSYNEFLFALVLAGSRTKTLPVAIASFGAEDISYWSLSAAGAIGISLPILVFILLMQRHLVRGLAMGAVK